MEFVSYTQWDQLPRSADALFASAATRSMFLSRPWFDALSATLADGEPSLLLACVVDGDEVLALLPLVQRGDGYLSSFTHNYTALFTLLLAEHDRDAILECLVAGLQRLSLVSLRLMPLAGDDDNIQRLQRAMEASGYRCHRRFRFYNWFHAVRGQSFGEYMADRPAQLRNTIARKHRKLQREHDCVIRLFAAEDIPRALADYHAAYQASWKASEQFRELIDALAVGLSRQGWTRLGVLYIDQRPAAAQLWFVLHGKANIFRLAYDEAWKRYSPGSILTHHLMQQVIDGERVDEIDFLVGNEPYKRDWMSQRRQRWQMGCVRQQRTPGARDRFLSALKGMLKAIGQRRGR